MYINLTNRTFGKLTVVEESRRNQLRSWICRCECGNETNVITSNLTGGKSKSCGHCFQLVREANLKEYMVWSSMKSRCDNKNHQAYKHYGGRGITYQESWGEFKSFLIDMGTKLDGLSLDRIDNDKNYSKANCRWATEIEQKNNQRTNRLLEFEGETKTMAEWAREKNINYRTLKSRLNIANWTVEEALTTKIKKHDL